MIIETKYDVGDSILFKRGSSWVIVEVIKIILEDWGIEYEVDDWSGINVEEKDIIRKIDINELTKITD